MAISDVKFTSHRREVESLVKAAVKRSLEICGGKAETYAKKRCPVKTGNLKNSITHQQTDEVTETIGTNVSYAPYVELGHHQTPGRYVPAIGKRLVADYVAGKPYLRPALEEHMDEYKKVMESELAKVGKGGVAVTIEALKD